MPKREPHVCPDCKRWFDAVTGKRLPDKDDRAKYAPSGGLLCGPCGDERQWVLPVALRRES